MKTYTRRAWTQEVAARQEDDAINALVDELGVRQWSVLASHLHHRFGIKHRSGKQCRERWHNHLDPAVLKEPWTAREEEKLFELHKVYGNSWAEISKHLPGRTDNAIKNHFYSSLRRNLRKFNRKQGGASQKELRQAMANPVIADQILRPNYHSALNLEQVRKSARTKPATHFSSDETLSEASVEEECDEALLLCKLYYDALQARRHRDASEPQQTAASSEATDSRQQSPAKTSFLSVPVAAYWSECGEGFQVNFAQTAPYN